MTIGETKLAVDSNGGAAIHGSCGNHDDGRRLVLNELRLQALDLHDDPVLEVLDLRGCGDQHHFHLQLDRLPSLREIHLPRLMGGAILHIFSLGMPASLMVNGTVSEIDADWQQGSLRLVSPRRGWEGARLLGHDAQPEDLALTHGAEAQRYSAGTGTLLTAILGSALLQDMLHQGTLRLVGEGTVYLADASSLERLVIDGPDRVSVQKARALRSLQLLKVKRFEGDQLDVLEWVDAGAGKCRAASGEAYSPDLPPRGHLTLRGKMPSLTLADAWGDVHLHAPRLQCLALGWADTLSLHHCGCLESVNMPDGLPVDCHGTVPTPLLHVARFFIDESTLKQTLARLEAGEHMLLDSVLTLLPQRAGPQAAFHGLTILVRLAEQNFDHVAIWECRRAMSAWQKIPHRRRQRATLTSQDLARADGQWHWDLPRDRCDEGMLADLHLWALCSASSEAARDYRRTLLASRHQQQSFQYLVRFGARPNAPAPIRSLMLDALVKEYGDGELPARLEKHGGKISHHNLARMVMHDTLTADQRHAVLGAISEAAPWEELPKLVATLLKQQSGSVRAFLMTLSRQPDSWFRCRLPGYAGDSRIRSARLQLTQLALMPSGAAPPMNEAPDDDLEAYLAPPQFIRRRAETDS